jgi:hypothetical protein
VYDSSVLGVTAPTVTIQSGPSCEENNVELGIVNVLVMPLPAEKKMLWPRSLAWRWSSVFEPLYRRSRSTRLNP